MAASAWVIYDDAKERLADGTFDLDGDTFKCALCATTHTPLSSGHGVYSDISANLSSDTDYAAVTCSGVTWDETNGTVTFDCNDISFGTSVTITARYAVLFDDTTTSDCLLAYSDLDDGGAYVASTNGTFEIQIHANGVFTLA